MLGGIGADALSAANPPEDFDLDRFLYDFEKLFDGIVSHLDNLDLNSTSLDELETNEAQLDRMLQALDEGLANLSD